MLLKPFNSLFPHLASTDLCRMVLSEAWLVATFDLIDWHCQDLLCDCYTANFVITKDKMIYATIAYGWKPPAFYYEAGLNKRTTRELRKGMVVPLAALFCLPWNNIVRRWIWRTAGWLVGADGFAAHLITSVNPLPKTWILCHYRERFQEHIGKWGL